MTLDIATLFAVTVFSMGLGGVLLLFAWLQARDTTALGWWGAAFLVFAPATALFGSRGIVADVWSIQAANALMMLGYGLLWTGARVFEGRRPVALSIVAGALIWLAACQVDGFQQSVPVRLILASGLVGAYTFAFVYELWRGRHDGLVSRWPVMAIALLHIILFPVRAPYLMSVPFPLVTPSSGSQTSSLLIFAPLLYSFAMVFLLMALTKERAESNQRYAATIDPLTGIPNRRGFSERAERLLARSRQDGGPVTLLLFDLDRFKSINDRFGHRTGDAVLALFTRSAAQTLRPLDLLGRIGGEEFIALLPGVSTEAAITVAERVRSNFAIASGNVDGQPVAATVSVGTACSAQGGYDFDALYAIADAALYRAKQKGRNRIEAGWPMPDSAGLSRNIMPSRAVAETLSHAVDCRRRRLWNRFNRECVSRSSQQGSEAMSAFAIRPPVQLRDGHSIASSSEAAALVRGHAIAHCSLAASVLLRRLEAIETSAEAQSLALEFRAWAAREGLLLKLPRTIAARPSRRR